MSTYTWSLATAPTRSTIPKTAYDYQPLPNKDQMSYLSDCLLIKAMCRSLLHSPTAFMLLSMVCTGVGMDHLNEHRASIQLQILPSQYVTPVDLRLRGPFSVLTNSVRKFNLNSSPPFYIVQEWIWQLKTVIRTRHYTIQLPLSKNLD